MTAYDAYPRMNGRNSNAECCVGNIIGTGSYLSESIPILHHKDQSVNVKCIAAACCKHQTKRHTVL